MLDRLEYWGDQVRMAIKSRDRLIRQAYHGGFYSSREIGYAVGLNHSTVLRVLAKRG
jgi:hypothetical protein